MPAMGRWKRDIHEHARGVARSFAGTEDFEKSRREREKVKMRCAPLKRAEARSASTSCPLGAQDEFVLAAIADAPGRYRRVLPPSRSARSGPVGFPKLIILR